jgi:hypothetical protein
MQRVYKYDASMSEDMQIEMPAGAKLLCVQNQNERPQLWALVDTSAPPAVRRVFFKVTGEDASEGTYIGTVLLNRDSFVVHYFDGGEV